MDKIYDAIIIVETNFQKNIAEKLVEQFFLNKEVLVVDARNNKIEIQGIEYQVHLGGLRWVLRSFGDIRELPKLKTKELIGTHFTGVNCRFFESFINYEKLSLIDDGIGTPAMLRGGVFIRTIDWYIRLIAANMFVFFVFGRLLRTINDIIERLSNYYTVYEFINNDYTDSLKKVNIKYIKFFDGYQKTKILEGKVCFIGSGVNPDLERCLKYVSQQHNHIYYFPHPRENVSPVVEKYVEKIIKPNDTIENYFKEHGAPEFIYGSLSSAILNMKLSKLDCKMAVFTVLSQNDPYFKLFEDNGICLINTNNIKI